MWVKEVEAYAEKRLNEGARIEGWGLKPKRAQRLWKNPAHFLEGHTSSVKGYKKMKDHGIKFLKTEAKSVAEVEKEMKRAKVPAQEIEEFFKANVVAVSSGTTLAQTQNDYAERDLESLFGDYEGADNGKR